MSFEFATAARIVFGAGSVRGLEPAARELGRRAFLVVGRGGPRLAALRDDLVRSGLAAACFEIDSEPTADLVASALAQARAAKADLVVAVGGGSALDAGKAVSALLTNPGEVLDYLEVVGRGQAIRHPAAPMIAVPTTAGTGSEVTRNSVIASPRHRMKASLRSPLMLPRLALVDPELTYDLPPAVTASTGLDALTQLIEPFVSARANPLVDSLCREGIPRAAGALRRAFHDGHDPTARHDMALASLFGGLALANAGLGAVHGFAAPIGGMFNAPHGAVCATLLAPVIRTNLTALALRAPTSPARQRYAEVARLLTGRSDAPPEAAADWVEECVSDLSIPRLRTWGIAESDWDAVVAGAEQASSMKANPILLIRNELKRILHEAW